MEATPDVYRADIAHTHEHIARIDAGDLLGDTPEQASERRARLVRQVATLERALARAEVLWAQAQAQERDSVRECGNCMVEGPTQPILLELPQGGEWIDLLVCPDCFGRLSDLRAR